ncbi:MAG: Ig-like domain-containing protein, partial [Clostridiales bacterium]|nr:Ig-like domain-containing protein [Clostridiales bacterium]
TVSESGLVTAVAEGKTLIRAQVEGGTLVCSVTVAQAYVYSLDKTALDIAVGASGSLTLITTPGGSATNRPHTFSSSNEAVVTVNGGTGRLTGVSKGTATITCLVDGQELTATVTVIEYTVKIGEEALTDEMTLLLGEEYDIEIETDPEREVSATYASSNEDVLTVTSNGHIVINRTGTATVTVTVGGKTFQTSVTVESDYVINHTESTLNLGATDGSNTVQLAVESKSGAESPNATYTSSDTSVATVNADGLVTATGIGSATINTTVTEEIVFETTITVVPDTALAHQDYTFQSGAVNLSYLDANKTIDWHQYYGDVVPESMANNAGLIGAVDYLGHTSENFWDYKAPVLYEDADADRAFGAYTYGKAVHGSYQIPVRVTNAVTKIVILTGSWKETATIEFKLGDTVLQSEQFVGGEAALARKYELTINTTGLKEGEELDLTIVVNCPREHGGNVSLVAVAVVGNEAHTHATTASTTGEATTGLTGTQDLAAEGTLDWLSANGTRKSGVLKDSIINESGIQYNPRGNDANDYPGANINGSTAFHWADNRVSIPALLYKGQSTVTVYATGWNCGYLIAAYDGYGNFVGGYQGADEAKDQSVSSKVVFNLNVEETGVFTFRIMKCRGAGNSGWAGIAVSSTSNVKPATLEY